jgi:hypothetical protein
MSLHSEPSTRDGRRAHRANKRACDNFVEIYRRLVSHKGEPLHHVRQLNPDAVRFPRMSQWRLASDFGAWRDIGSGAIGNDLIDLIVWLSGGCDRDKAIAFLENLCDDLESVS